MKRLLIVLAVIGLIAGCVTTDQQLSDRVAKLERQLKQVQIAGASGTGASFYPASQGLEKDATGYLGKISSTADDDVAFVVINSDPVWGDAFFPYTLDATGDADRSGATPYAVKAKDGGTELWRLPAVYGMRLYGNIPLIVSGVSSTIGTDTDGELTRIAMGGTIYIDTTAASGVTITLPEIVAVGSGTSKQVEPGASVCIASGETDTVQIWVDPNAADSIVYNKARGAVGKSIYTGAASEGCDFVCLEAVKHDVWFVWGYSGTWTAE